jgi:hypothetical protein
MSSFVWLIFFPKAYIWSMHVLRSLFSPCGEGWQQTPNSWTCFCLAERGHGTNLFVRICCPDISKPFFFFATRAISKPVQGKFVLLAWFELNCLPRRRLWLWASGLVRETWAEGWCCRLHMKPYFNNAIMALFSCHANPKYFLFHPSHRIFRRMHGVLNIGKKDN